jgi:hypothetical protein
MSTTHTATTCPFCGVVTTVPHNTQECCIEALHAEIRRMRELLERVRPSGSHPPAAEPPDEEPGTGQP